MFDEATTLSRLVEGRFAWQVPDGWQMGRGAWGGLVVGALVRAVTLAEPDPARAPRSVSLHIMAPVLVGSHTIEVAPMRVGSAMSTWRAEAYDGAGSLVASMVAITGGPRAAGADSDGPWADGWGVVSPPAIPPAEDVTPVPGGPPLPTFTRHLDMRPVSGLPLSGGTAESTGWIGFATPATPTAASVLALVDAWWPASLPLLTAMPRISTVDFAASLLVDPATLRPGEPLLQHSFLAGSADGFTSEHRRLWTADGRLVVDNLQSIVVDI